MQAAIGLEQLKKLDFRIERKQEIGAEMLYLIRRGKLTGRIKNNCAYVKLVFTIS